MLHEHKIRTVLFREGEWWVAQCLDVDIAAQARTESALLDELERLLVGRIVASDKLGIEPFTDLPPAPKRYWDLFFAAQSRPRVLLPRLPDSALSHPLPEVEMRVS